MLDRETLTFGVLRAFTVSKRADAPNEDSFRVSDDKTVCAISDGASISFDSAPWAQLLCRRFVEGAAVTSAWIDAATSEYQLNYDRDSMPWSHQAAFDRGSFATLLGVVCSSDSKGASVFCVGDSLLAFVDKGSLVRTIPYVAPEEFGASPFLISTKPAENTTLDEEGISEAWHQITLASHEEPFLMLMTDALGQWLLDQPDASRVAALLSVSSDESFAKFIETERSEGRMKRDDCTLVVMGYERELSADN